MYRNGQLPAVPVFVRVSHQLDEHEGHEQGGEEVKDRILIRGNAEIGTFLVARLRQADLVAAGDLPDQLILEYLQPCAKPDDDAAAHRVGRLLEDVIGCLCRVGDRKQVEKAVQLLFRVHGQQLINLPDVLSLRWESLVHIQHKGFQQVHLRVVPEVVAFRGAGVFDDDIGKELRHDLLSFNLRKAVPTVGIFGVDEVEHPHGIAIFLKVEAHIRVKLRFRIGDDEAFPALDALEHHISRIGAAFHAAAGAKDCHIAVHPCLFRQADCLSVQLSQDDAPVPCNVGNHLQHPAHLGVCHKAGGAVGPLIRVGQVPFLVVGAFPAKPHPHHHENQQSEDAGAEGDSVEAVREYGERFETGSQ